MKKNSIKLEAAICTDNERFWGELIEIKPNNEEEILFSTSFCDTEDEARDELKRYLRIAQEKLPSLAAVGASI